MKPKIVVLGGSFAGLTVAFDLKYALKNQAEITVVDQKDHFVFVPSLVWVLPGNCDTKRITFALRPALEAKGIGFIQARADQIEAEQNRMQTTAGEITYDYLVIATGAEPNWDAIPGLGPDDGYTESVCSLPHALEGCHAWQKFLQDPGPVVLGATQGASCFGAEYEVAFNLDRALRKAGVRDQAPVTFLTAEPFLGHLGFGGIGQGRYVLEDRFRKQQIEWITSASIDQATPGEMHLADGRVLPFKYSVVIPPFRGSQVLRDTPDLANAQGFVPVNNHYRHTTYDNVYAAGVIVAASSPEETPVPCGVPKTGLMCEIMGKTAAHNIVADLTGKQPKELPFNDLHTMCVLDTGESAFMVASDRIFGDRNIAIFTREGPWWHWFKMGFEQYHTWKMRTGRVYLP